MLDSKFVKQISNYRNLTEHVYSILEESILNKSLKPGQELVEYKIAEWLGTSATPVREALNRLISEGLVKKTPNKIPKVVKLTKKEIEEIYDIRIALESLGIAEAACNINPENINELKELQEKGENNYHKGDPHAFFEYNNNFHALIINIANNNLLADMIDSINKKISLCTSSSILIAGRIEKAIKEHRSMIDLLEKQEAEAAKNLMQKHIERAREDLFTGYSE